MKMDSDIEQSVRKWFERILDSPLQVCLFNTILPRSFFIISYEQINHFAGDAL